MSLQIFGLDDDNFNRPPKIASVLSEFILRLATEYLLTILRDMVGAMK